MNTTIPEVILLCDDLIFISKVLGVAGALDLKVAQARDWRKLIEQAKKTAPRLVLLDLHNPGLDLNSLLSELRLIGPAMPRILGYGSHVDVATLRAARAAGCDVVWPRSKFVDELPNMKSWLAESFLHTKFDEVKDEETL
jgi:CheY-like chemotaxis protein